MLGSHLLDNSKDFHACRQLAVSTRPNEYKAYTGFISAEDGEMGRKAFFSGLVGQRARKLVLHGVENRHYGLAEADAEDDDTPLTPVNANAVAPPWSHQILDTHLSDA